jgi:hypothetical protein
MYGKHHHTHHLVHLHRWLFSTNEIHGCECCCCCSQSHPLPFSDVRASPATIPSDFSAHNIFRVSPASSSTLSTASDQLQLAAVGPTDAPAHTCPAPRAFLLALALTGATRHCLMHKLARAKRHHLT